MNKDSILECLIKHNKEKIFSLEDENLRKYNSQEIKNLVFNIIDKFKKKNIKKVIIFSDNSLETIINIFVLSYFGCNLRIDDVNISNKAFKVKFLEYYKKNDIIFLPEYIKKKYKLFLEPYKKKIQIIKINELNKKKLYRTNKNLIIKNIFFNNTTSGTTANPKELKIHTNNYFKRAIYAIKQYKIQKNNTLIISTPLTHSLAIKVLFISLKLGAKLILLNKFTAKKWIQIIKNNMNCVSFLTSSQIKNLTESQFYKKIKSNNIDSIISCADKLDLIIKKKLISNLKNFKAIKFYDTYGTTETDGISSYNILNTKLPLKSVGKINKSFDIKIFKNGKQQKSNIIGDIYCKSPLICELVKSKTSNNFFIGRYYKTGDQGYINNKKILFFTGRDKNKIIVSGINIYAEKIEEIIKKSKLIEECIVVGMKNKNFGQLPMAIILLKKNDNLSKKKIENFIDISFSSYEKPRKIMYVNNIKRNELDKINRKFYNKNYSNKFLSL